MKYIAKLLSAFTLTLLLGVTGAVGGSVSTNPTATGVQPNGYLGSFAYASLPAASSSSGRTAIASDVGVAPGTMLISNGTRWLPVGGRALLKHLAAASGNIANTSTVIIQAQLPAGALQANDSIVFDITSVSKSGATDTAVIAAYAGTAGTTSDTNILPSTNTLMAAANLSASSLIVYKVIDNTHVQRVGTINGSGVYGGGGVASVAIPSSVAITDLSANSLYFSFAILSGGTTNTVACQEAAIYWVAR